MTKGRGNEEKKVSRGVEAEVVKELILPEI